MAGGCCGGGASRRVGRGLVTSGDLAVPPEPLAVLGLDEPAPDGASYRVVTTTEVAYFSGHVPAMAWQGSNGGKLRTV